MKDESVPAETNLILADLPPDVTDRLTPHLEYIDAGLEMPVYRSYEPIDHVYFPTNALISIVATTSSGQSTEIGVVGREGAAGLEAVMGVNLSPHHSMVQIAGPVWQIGAAELNAEFRRCGILHDRILHFVQKLSVQVSQTTLCNRLHTIDERLPRWLLMCDDRIKGDTLLLTQEFIALMLGTSRVTVTQTAHQLQQVGHIKYSRGRIHILDRQSLEDAACECYHIVKREYERTPA